MGWWRKWREGRAREPGGQTPPQESPLTTADLIDRIERQNLSRLEIESKIRLAELEASAEERKEERDYRRKEKERERERKRQAAEHMREIRKSKRTAGPTAVPPFASNCEDCRARLENRSRTHTRDMIRHAEQQHDLLFEGQHGN